MTLTERVDRSAQSDMLNDAVKEVRHVFRIASPRAALILGSGWSKAAGFINPAGSIPYGEIPGLGTPGVSGHPGRLDLATHAGMEFLVFHGRRHFYEGLGWAPVCVPVHISLMLGADSILLTNSAGAINPDLAPGNAMIISDHINLMGSNPLIDLPFDRREMFPDQTQVYDPELSAMLAGSCDAAGMRHIRGIYAGMTGPAYETPAETAALARMGADAAGMSTVPEAMFANAAGLKVAAISLISNFAAGRNAGALSHDEVLSTSKRSEPRMKELLRGFMDRIADHAE